MKKLYIACQGGGSHTAFTAGVLKKLLDDRVHERYRLVALSGTSGGAMCAALVWYATALGLSDDANLADTVIKNTSSYSRAERVAAGQTLLINLGALSGPADGQSGPATRRALNEVFAARGLPAPGDDITLDVLSRLTQME